MSKLNRVLSAGLFAVAFPAIASAASINEDSLSALSSPSVNLSSSTAFAYYGDNSATGTLYTPGIDTSPTTDVGNLGNFTAFTTFGGAVAEESNDNFIQISYASGAGGSNPSSETNATNFDFGYIAGGFSLTSTLFAPTETFSIYLQDYDTTSDFTASLNDAANTTLSLNNQVLFGGTDDTGSGNSTGVLTFTVTGDIGDVLTFTEAADFTGVNQPGSGNVGLDAVTIDIPEPSTYAMIGVGALALGWCLRRGKFVA